jgi:hypothetical protein
MGPGLAEQGDCNPERREIQNHTIERRNGGKRAALKRDHASWSTYCDENHVPIVARHPCLILDPLQEMTELWQNAGSQLLKKGVLNPEQGRDVSLLRRTISRMAEMTYCCSLMPACSMKRDWAFEA